MTTVCAWQIPGYPKYICIKERHDNVPKDCKPEWVADKVRKAALLIKSRQGV
jgi:hypothetical protein